MSFKHSNHWPVPEVAAFNYVSHIAGGLSPESVKYAFDGYLAGYTGVIDQGLDVPFLETRASLVRTIDLADPQLSHVGRGILDAYFIAGDVIDGELLLIDEAASYARPPIDGITSQRGRDN